MLFNIPNFYSTIESFENIFADQIKVQFFLNYFQVNSFL